MDTLTVKGMQFRAFHGVQDFEKKEGNDFVVDVIFHLDMSAAADSDDLQDAINYTQVQELTSSIMDGPSVDLIEHLCFQIGQLLASKIDGYHTFEVAIRKLNPPIKATVEYTEARMSWPR